MNKIISWKLELFIVKIHMRYHNKWLVHHGYHFMRHVISYRDLEILLLDMLIEMECSEDGLARTQLATLFFFPLTMMLISFSLFMEILLGIQMGGDERWENKKEKRKKSFHQDNHINKMIKKWRSPRPDMLSKAARTAAGTSNNTNRQAPSRSHQLNVLARSHSSLPIFLDN